MKKPKISKKTEYAIAVVIILLVLMNVYLLFLNNKNKTLTINNELKEIEKLNLTKDPFSTKEFTKVNVSVRNNTIILEGNCTIFGLVPHEIQTYSIKEGLDKNIDIRPTTHDLITNILENYNISVLLIKITDGKEGLYFSNIIFKEGNSILNVDSRPSDAIALGVRTNAPIYVKNSVLEKYGEKTC